MITALVWLTTVVCLAAIGAVATLFILIATSLDPVQIINAGAEPWVDAAEWSAAFLGIIVLAAIGLRLWHSARLRPLSLALLAAQVAFVGWAGWLLYTDYL